MAQHGFFQYIRLKLIATLFRLLSRLPPRRGLEEKERLFLKDDHRELLKIPSRDKGRYIAAWLYTGPTGTAPIGKMSVLVNWHGSGFMLPNLGTDAGWCSQVARETGCLVLDADYRKSPETPFPGAINDAEDTLNWVASQPDRFDLSRIGVSGFSSGGLLALVASSSIRQAIEAINISVVVTFYGGTDMNADPILKSAPKPGKIIPPKILRLFYDSYLPPGILREDPRVSPAFAASEWFPDTVVLITCDGDTLCPEANELAKRLDDGRRKVINETLENVSHGFDKHTEPGSHTLKQREHAYSLAIQGVKEAFEA